MSLTTLLLVRHIQSMLKKKGGNILRCRVMADNYKSGASTTPVTRVYQRLAVTLPVEHTLKYSNQNNP